MSKTRSSRFDARACSELGALPLPVGERVGVRGIDRSIRFEPPHPARQGAPTSPRQGEVTRGAAVRHSLAGPTASPTNLLW